jgi:hypothetical protein
MCTDQGSTSQLQTADLKSRFRFESQADVSLLKLLVH